MYTRSSDTMEAAYCQIRKLFFICDFHTINYSYVYQEYNVRITNRTTHLPFLEH